MWVATSGVHRMGRAVSWQVKAVIGMAAATVTGAAAGALLGAIGGLFSESLRAGVATGAVVGLLVLLMFHSPLPQFDRETPQELLHRGPIVWSAANGALLGLAVTSRLGFWLWYAIPLGVFLGGSGLMGGAVWAIYGFVRLGFVAAVAAHMRGGDAATHAITKTLIASAPHLRSALTAVVVIASVATLVWVGL